MAHHVQIVLDTCVQGYMHISLSPTILYAPLICLALSIFVDCLVEITDCMQVENDVGS
jgi:hypothetical protein